MPTYKVHFFALEHMKLETLVNVIQAYITATILVVIEKATIVSLDFDN